MLFLLVFSFFAAASPELVLAGPVDALAVAGDRVAVVQGDVVRILAGDGRPLGTLGHPDPPRRRPDDPARRQDDVLERFHLTEDDRDTNLADELVDDELTLRERRRPAEVTTPRSPALLAAAGDELWAAAGGALYQVDGHGQARRVRALPAVDHLAADRGGWLLVARGSAIWRSRDGGETLTRAAQADGPVRGLAAAGGRLAWATDTRLVVDGVGLTLPAPLLDLRFCGHTLLALHAGGLLAVEGGRTRPIAGVPPARRLGCDGERWLLIGAQLTSPTGAVDDAGLAVTSAETAAAGLWLGTRQGLYLLTGQPGPATLLVPSGQGRRARPRLAGLLPRLVVTASDTRRDLPSRQRDDLRLFAFADFPLDRGEGHAVASDGAAAPLVPQLPPVETGCLAAARAVAVARALAEPERARSYIRRAGHAAWLPELRLRLERHLGRSESLDLPAGSVNVTGPLGLDSANDVRYEARATWDLSRLVFSSDEIAAEAQALRMADVRRELESLVNRLYFEQRRVMLDAELTPDPTARARTVMRADEVAAELSALTGGASDRCGVR